MRKLRLQAKLIVVSVGLLFFTASALSIVSTIAVSKAYNKTVVITREKLDTLIKSEVDCLIGVLDENYKLGQEGKITPEEAKARAEHIVRTTRYNNGSGYFWADTYDGTCIIHTNEKLQGTFRYDDKDQMGNYFIRDLLNAGKKPDGGFTDFYFPKLGEKTAKLKRGYFKCFKPYDWNIGTGNYEEDMLGLIQPQIDESNSQKTKSMIRLLLISVLSLGIGITIMVILSKKLARPITECTERITRLATGDLKSPVPIFDSQDETGDLSRSTKLLIDELSNVITDITNCLSSMSAGNFDIESKCQYQGDFIPIQTAITSIIDSLNSEFLFIYQSSEQVGNGSEQVSTSAQALAQGATEQASAIERLSSTISEISQQITNNAKSANEAHELSVNASNEVEVGNAQMKEVTVAMSNIADTSTQISKIIKTIDDIA
ncbi:MAG: methyl-accepting chemotaxis protein, partial [Oscillospiraceae bacterium]